MKESFLGLAKCPSRGFIFVLTAHQAFMTVIDHGFLKLSQRGRGDEIRFKKLGAYKVFVVCC